MFIFTDTDIADVISKPINDCGDKLQEIREDLLNGVYEKEIFSTTCKQYDIVEKAICVCNLLEKKEIAEKIYLKDTIENYFDEIFSKENLENKCVQDLYLLFQNTKKKITIQAFLIVNSVVDKIREVANTEFNNFFATGNEYKWEVDKIFDFLQQQKNKEITIDKIKKGYPKQQNLFLW